MKNTNHFTISRSTIHSLLSIGAFLLFSCNAQPPDNSKYAQAQRGKEHFLKYCAECHGEDAKGLEMDNMDPQPANLTIIQSRRREPAFPVLDVARLIDGRKMSKAHGTRQMPVWGEVFSEEELLDESQIKGKLGELIAYLMSIQE